MIVKDTLDYDDTLVSIANQWLAKKTELADSHKHKLDGRLKRTYSPTLVNSQYRVCTSATYYHYFIE